MSDDSVSGCQCAVYVCGRAPSTRLRSRRSFAVPGFPGPTPGDSGQRAEAFVLLPMQLPICLPYSYSLHSGALAGQTKAPSVPFFAVNLLGSFGSAPGHELWLQ